MYMAIVNAPTSEPSLKLKASNTFYLWYYCVQDYTESLMNKGATTLVTGRLAHICSIFYMLTRLNDSALTQNVGSPTLDLPC